MSSYNNLNIKDLEKILKDKNIYFESAEERIKNHTDKINYKNYPFLNEETFYDTINNKKEFVDTRYDLSEIKKMKDSQKTLCPGDNKKFKLLNHQIFVKNYLNSSTPYKSLLLFHGLGCHAYDTEIMLYNGLCKKVQDISINDKLMGDDNTPRTVLELKRGKDLMYKITPNKGESFIINQNHILCLKQNNQGINIINDSRCKNQRKIFNIRYMNCKTYIEKSKSFVDRETAEKYLKEKLSENKIMEIKLMDYLNLSNRNKSCLKLFKTHIEFPHKNLSFDPYIIGFWLGDGNKRDTVLTTQDSEVIKYLYETLKKYKLYFRFHSGYSYRVCTEDKKNHIFLSFLKENKMINNKHIPDILKYNSEEIRLQVLAGLIDSDGYLNKNTFSIAQKNEKIIDDIIYLSRSLGFACYKSIKKTSWTYKGIKKIGSVFRISISGNINKIPTKIKRKNANIRLQKKNVLVTGFSVEKLNVNDFYGFTLDNNHRYLTGDFIVHHNSGKTCSAITIAETYKRNLIGNISKKALVLVSGSAIEQNFRKEIHDINKGYNQCTFSEYLTYKPYEPEIIKQKKVDNLIDSFYEIEHYQRFTNKINNIRSTSSEEEYKTWIENNYSNRVFIIDEVHNLKEKIEENKNLKRYDIVKDIISYSKNIQLILLSGTPMSHSSKEIINVLNLMLYNEGYNPINTDDYFDANGSLLENKITELRNLFRGFISFVRQENPYTFANKDIEGEYIDKIINEKFEDLNIKIDINMDYKIFPCYMEGKQLEHYMNYIKTKKINSTEMIQLGLFGYDVDNKKQIYRLPFDTFSINNIKNYSIKYYNLYQNILKSPVAPIFIYSNYRERGILMLVSMLLKNGIKLSNTVRKNDPILFSKKTFSQARSNPVNPLCYKCYKPERTHDTDHKFYPLSFEYIIGETQEDIQAKIINTFNSYENRDGKLIKILIGSSVLKEGVSLKNTRQVHIMDPWHNLSRIRQIIGRALRHCSHKDLDKKDRNVKIYQYASLLEKKYDGKDYKDIINELYDIRNIEIPVNIIKMHGDNNPLFSYDLAVYKRANLLDKEIKKIEKVLKEVAIDCHLNKELNIDTLDEKDKYECSFIDYQTEKKQVLDLSTYNTVFKQSYIDYAILIVKEMFKNILLLSFDEIINYDEFNSNIYKDNNYEIIKRALKKIVPEKKSFHLFNHIFQGGYNNKYGYVIGKTIKNKNIYIFQELDGTEKERSEYENYPLYHKLKKEKVNENNFNYFVNFLNITDEKYKNIDIIQKINPDIKNRKVTAKINIGKVAMEIIKNNDPIEKHIDDGPIVGIIIEKQGEDFKNKLWIRINKYRKQKENEKQYNYGKYCENYTRKEITDIINNIWNKVLELNNKDFIEKNKKSIEDINKKVIKKKKLTCDILQNLLQHINKYDNKVWFKII